MDARTVTTLTDHTQDDNELTLRVEDQQHDDLPFRLTLEGDGEGIWLSEDAVRRIRKLLTAGLRERKRLTS